MTTVRGVENTEIHAELALFRDQLKSTAILQGFLVFITVVIAVMLLFALVAGLNLLVFARGSGVRWVALAVLLGASAAAFGLCVLRPLLWNPTFDQLARLAETAIPDLDNACINAVQLTRGAPGASSGMVARAIAECVRRSRRFNLQAAVDRRRLARAAVSATILAAAMLLYALLAPRNLVAGLAMLLNPSRFVPAVAGARISYVRPGDVDVLRGRHVRIEAATARPVKLPCPAWVYIAHAGGARTRRTLSAVSPTEFAADLGPADTPYDYLLEIAGSQTRWFRLTVSEKPSVKDLSVLYEYPAYTQLPSRGLQHFDGALNAPYATKVTLRVEATRPLASARLDLAGQISDFLASGDDYHRQVSFVPRADGIYRILLADADGNANNPAPSYSVRVIQDQPPLVSIPVPGRDLTAALGSYVTFAVEASDDYGLADVQLVLAEPGLPGETVLRTWANVLARAATLTHNLLIDPDSLRPGKTYSIFARASDANTLTGPGVAVSARYDLKVLDEDAARSALLNALQDVFDSLAKILSDQEAARDLVRSVAAAPSRGPVDLPRVSSAQASIRDQTLRVSARIADDSAVLREVRGVLQLLAAGDMMRAVDLSAQIAAAPSPPSAAGLEPLAALQDSILETLRRLMGAVEALIDDVKSGRLTAANEIPAAVEDQLRGLFDDLRRFLEDQKRIVEASNNLSAKPVNDYTDEDKRRLLELAAAEEDWSKFLKERYSDLSKLPSQDFADPTLLQDLVETYSEIEMAADALSKEAVTIAVPHEQVGLELAEELTTHLEKWLPDAPDRIKWVMEEPLTEINAPMAELPASLQDIIGDLMEEEQALFDDIEDVSSSWADSLDKGAGWDAMDGPISNMSAQGVTGNVLPNASEIAGRSGEGRTGRASGEFVGDTAVGKGGRRTPTRITPDDFLAGRVDDVSGQAAAGATGGGKESGAGARGLQGPVPRQLSDQIAALAGRQAEITSAAQKVSISVRLVGYPNADMDGAVAAMKATEDSLRTGSLRGALRQRPVLITSLKKMTSIVGSDVVIRKDNTLVLPGGLRDEIMDGVEGRSPRGYEMLLKGYYESLSVAK